MKSVFKTIEHYCDFCVVGGGLAGTIGALAAARKGAKVVLIQDRPVLGGNSSSEIRMWVRGARGYCNKETGILAEFEEENIYRNPMLEPTLWDSVLFGKVKENENITLLLNASCLDAECEDCKITSVTAWQMTTYTYHKVNAKCFADCSGDGVLAFLTGAQYKIGREAHSEYREKIGPEVSDNKTMGMSILLQARETHQKVKFIPPKWANVYKTDEEFAIIPYLEGQHSTLRDHKIGTSGCNLWWMELGGDTNAIENTEEIRDELMKLVFGIWDHIKNQEDHGCDNWELEWVGFLPGKRESVRYIGDYILTQNDIEEERIFDDVIAYGGWPMDDHNPKGMKANKKGDSPSKMFPAPSPYEIPYRCIYSKNIKNLFFAGRNISATHGAMSSTRVMGTCSLLGQAMGNAAAVCIKYYIYPRELLDGHIAELQKEVMDDGIMLPNTPREISDVTKSAKMNISVEEKNILFNGIERPRKEGDKNFIKLKIGDKLSFDFDEPVFIDILRIQFDLDFSRMSVSPNRKMRIFAQKLHRGLDFEPVKVPKTIVKAFKIVVDGNEIYNEKCNFYSLVKVPIKKTVKKIEIAFEETWGSEYIIIYGCDFI